MKLFYICGKSFNCTKRLLRIILQRVKMVLSGKQVEYEDSSIIIHDVRNMALPHSISSITDLAQNTVLVRLSNKRIINRQFQQKKKTIDFGEKTIWYQSLAVITNNGPP